MHKACQWICICLWSTCTRFLPPSLCLLQGELERVSYQVFKVPPSMLAPHVLEGVLSLLRRGVDPVSPTAVIPPDT